MSHFIEGIELKGPLVFNVDETKRIKPKMKTFLRSNTLKKFLENK